MRSRPTPSAPWATAFAASPGAPRLAKTSIRVPSAQRGGRRRGGQRLRPRGRLRVAARLVVGDGLRAGVDVDHARAAVERQRRAVGDGEHVRAGADHGGDPERAGDDRGVPGGAAARGDEPEGALGVERRGLARRELVGEHDAGLAQQRAAVDAGEPRQHAARDVLDVHGALAQVGVVERAEGGGRLPGGVAPRGARRRAVGDALLRAG